VDTAGSNVVSQAGGLLLTETIRTVALDAELTVRSVVAGGERVLRDVADDEPAQVPPRLLGGAEHLAPADPDASRGAGAGREQPEHGVRR
jgi:hypothetical protein